MTQINFNELTTEELKKMQAENATKAKAKVEDLVERSMLISGIKKTTDPAFLHATAVVERQTQVTDQLTRLVDTCAGITSKLPVQNPNTLEQRQFSRRKLFGFGNHVGLVYQLLNGIQYSTEVHKTPMLEATNLSVDLIESTLEAFGNPAYYHYGLGIIVPAKPYDVKALLGNLAIIENKLGVELNLHDVTEKQFEAVYANELAKAKKNAEDAKKTDSMKANLIVQ